MGDDFYIPMALDPNPIPGPSPANRPEAFELHDEPMVQRSELPGSSDYFGPRANRASRKLSKEQPTSNSRRTSNSTIPSSPHIAYQEKEWNPNNDGADAMKKRKGTGSTSFDHSQETNMRSSQTAEVEGENFKLQEAPKRRKSASSRGDTSSTLIETPTIDSKVIQSAPATAHMPLREQTINTSDVARSASQLSAHLDSPRISIDSRTGDNTPTDSPLLSRSELPKRGDSLQKSATIQKKEIGSMAKRASSSLANDHIYELPSPVPSTSVPTLETSSSNINGGKVISRPIESPVSKSSMDLPPRSKDRPTGAAAGDSFVSPRAPPQPPAEGTTKHKAKNASISTLRSESTKNGDMTTSPGMLRYQKVGDLSMAEDMDRIMGGEETDQSFLRRVSKSVRHARSHSDRGSRLSKEPKWPKSPVNGIHEIGSPVMSSPEARDEVGWYKNELRKERQRATEKEEKISELEAALDDKSAIKQMNSELREKRSTMVVLDTQKEIVVRELETLTEHIAAAKKSREPLNVDQLQSVVLRKFAEELQKLKDQFTPQIEELTERRNDLTAEVARLGQMKDKSFQEFEQVSLKNAQLAELNNTLVHQIQELYKAGSEEPTKARGLGIYTHHSKEKSSASIDSGRLLRPSITESHLTGSTMAQEHEIEQAAILQAPQVVNIRKEQPKKTFNWKKGGNVAKGMTKGLKGAFSSNENKVQRENYVTSGLTEGTPYGAMSQSGDLPTTTLPKSAQSDGSRQGFGFFGQPKSKGVLTKSNANGHYQGPVTSDPSILYGTELEQRAEYERVNIPGIITRCIQEVELRGKTIGIHLTKSSTNVYRYGL